jgi:hypothetical protein
MKKPWLAIGLVSLLAAPAAQAAITIEDFESGNLSQYATVGGPISEFTVSSAYKHDGNFGLGALGQNAWAYRNDAGAQVSQGQTLSVWVNFFSTADARAYFGFGASALGTLSFVLAPNTGDIRFQENAGYAFNELNSSAQSFTADKWYRAEVIWGVGGSLTGNLFDSDGTTLLNTVTAASTLYSSGGIAFRGFGGVKAFDTVTVDSVAVPEPSTYVAGALLLLPIGAQVVRRLRTGKQVS